jgi:ADP-ribose pyrophosphatase
VERYFATSVYVYQPQQHKFLFVFDSVKGLWSQPQKVMLPNELPDEFAKRTVYEQTGIKVFLAGDLLPSDDDESRPYGIQRDIVIDHKCEYLSLIYLGIPEVLTSKPGKENAQWFSLDEIISNDFKADIKSKKWCRYFASLHD